MLGLSQIAAAASVLNLGVSVLGFAYMGYKLNQVQKSVGELANQMNAGFDHVDQKLDHISQQLHYVTLLTGANLEEQRRMGQALSEVHRLMLIQEYSDLQSWLSQLQRFPNESPIEAIRVAGRVRNTLADQAIRQLPEFTPQTMVIADIAVRGWAVATVTEANLLMNIGKHREAMQLIEEEQPRFRKLSENWAHTLLADESKELQTAYRFNTPRFRDDILEERVARIARLHNSDSALTDLQRKRLTDEAEIELSMSYNKHLDKRWMHQQLGVAEYLDGLSELSERLQSTGSFAQECEIRGVKSSRELLPDENAKPGLYLLPAAE